MVIRMLIALFALIMPVAAMAANDVSIVSDILVERLVKQPDGKTRVVVEKLKSSAPGAKLIFVLAYRNQGKAPAKNFSLVDPIPAGVAFDSAVTPGSDVSVDGGKSWGQLPALRTRAADGTLQAAQPSDVTHIRWILKAPIPVGGTGKLSFRGVVK